MSKTMAPTSLSTTAVAWRRCGWSGKGKGLRPCADTVAPGVREVHLQGSGEFPMHVQRSQQTSGLRRRDLLKAGLVAGVTLSAWPLADPSVPWGADAGPPKRGGILRVWGYDPPHFDPQLTTNGKTHTTLSFVYSTLLRHKV